MAKLFNHCAPFFCTCAECSLSIVVFHSHWGFQMMLALALGMTCFIAFLNLCIYADLTMEPLLLQEGATFDTLNSFQTTLDEYSKACHIQCYCVNSRTVVAANKLLASNSTQYNTKIKYAYINKTLYWLFTTLLPCVHSCLYHMYNIYYSLYHNVAGVPTSLYIVLKKYGSRNRKSKSICRMTTVLL